MIRIGHVLCPVDFSLFSTRALRHAAAWATWYGARLTVLHVWHEVPAANVIPSLQAPPEAEPILSGERADMEARMREYCAEVVPGVAVSCRLVHAPNVQDEIVDQADVLGADLLLMGSHGRSGFTTAGFTSSWISFGGR